MNCTNAIKTRSAAVVSFLILALFYLFFNSNLQVRGLRGTHRFHTQEQPASKLSPISNPHQLSPEELAIKLNETSDITCGGIDVNSILSVKAATNINANLDTFLSSSDNYPQLGLPPSTWDTKSERAFWAHLNAVALWRPKTRTYWTIQRVYYWKDRGYTHPWFSYAWWEEWNEAVTQRVSSGAIPIFIPQHRTKSAPEGPEDPRLFEDPYGHICFVFGMLDIDDMIKIWIYNTTTHRQVALHSPDGREAQRVEKNWTPFLHNNQVKFVFSYKPITIIACDFTTGTCHYDYADEKNPGIEMLHGGSNWVPWYDSGYYIGFPHTRMNKGHVLFRPLLMVLSTHNSVFRIAYASGPLDFQNVTLLAPLGPHSDITALDEREADHGRILLSGSISRTDLFDQNSILVTVSTSDKASALLEIGGIRDVMEAVIGKVEGEEGWRVDDGKVVGCAEGAAEGHFDDVFGKYG